MYMEPTAIAESGTVPIVSDDRFALLAKWHIGAFGRMLHEIRQGESFDGLTFGEEVELCIDTGLTTHDSRKIDKAARSTRFTIKGACVEEICRLPDRTLLQPHRRARIQRMGGSAQEPGDHLRERRRQNPRLPSARCRRLQEAHDGSACAPQRYVLGNQFGKDRRLPLRGARPLLYARLARS